MVRILPQVFISVASVGWLPILLWGFELRTSLPNGWESWLDMHDQSVLLVGLIGTGLWIMLMGGREFTRLRDAYYRYVKPQIKFVVKKHIETGQLSVLNDSWVLRGVVIELDGYFENDGATPSTVKMMEVQLVEKWGIFKYSKVLGRKRNRVVFTERGKYVTDEHRGYYVGEFWTSPVIWGNGTCIYKDIGKHLDKLNEKYQIRLKWYAKGQAIKDTDIIPNWDLFKRDVKEQVGKPIPDTSMPENLIA